MRVLLLAVVATAISCERVSILCSEDSYPQTKLSTLIFAPMIPGFLFAFGSLEPMPWVSFTPMLGQLVMLTAVTRGDIPALASLLVLSAVTLAAVSAAWMAAGHQLGHEPVLRRANG